MVLADPALQWLCALTLALLFGSAAWHKVKDRRAFVGALGSYDVLPQGLVPTVALLMIAAEVLTAFLLLLPLTRAVGAVAAIGLLAVYTSAIGWNLWRGRLDMDCGCMGAGSKALSGWLVLRNLLVMGGSVPLLTTGDFVRKAATDVSVRILNVVDLVTIAGGVCALALLYLALDRLIANHLAQQAWLQSDA